MFYTIVINFPTWKLINHNWLFLICFVPSLFLFFSTINKMDGPHRSNWKIRKRITGHGASLTKVPTFITDCATNFTYTIFYASFLPFFSYFLAFPSTHNVFFFFNSFVERLNYFKFDISTYITYEYVDDSTKILIFQEYIEWPFSIIFSCPQS